MIKKYLISFIFGAIFLHLYNLSRPQTIVYVPEIKKEIVYKTVEKIVEKEKVVYKKRSCKMTDDAKMKMCTELLSANINEESQSDMEPAEQIEQQKYTIVDEKDKKHRVNFHLGYGSTKFKMKYENNKVMSEEEQGKKASLQYQYKFNNDYNISTSVETDGDVFIGFGTDF